jgi:glycosyltransferase involved in cell wall biosynthesis
MAGDGSLRDRLAAGANALGLGDRCCFLGHRSDVAGLQSAFDLFVQSSDYEGTSNAVLEAMACETPIVATDAGGTAELVRPGVDGVVVPRSNTAALRAAIDGCLRDAAAVRCRAVSARRRVETDLSFDRRMDNVERIYTMLAAARSRRGDGRVPSLAETRSA